MANIQSKTRGEIRRSIERTIDIAIIGVATETTDATSLIDDVYLQGGDDDHNMNEVLIYETTDDAAPLNETSAVSDYTGSTHDATLSPTLTAAITKLDKYEMVKWPWRMADVNDAINRVLMSLTSRCPQIKEDSTLFTESDKYLYTIPSGFTHLSKIEWVYSRKGNHTVSDCETIWTSGDTDNVTVTLDSSFEKVGTSCMKAVEDGGSGAGAILCYIPITSLDISDSNKVEFWMYSSIALTAGQLQIHLSSTAIIASAEETIDIPAMTAATWYKHSLSLEAPHSDTAIISAGIYQVSDVGAFTFYVDQVETVDTFRELYKPLVDEYWDIARGSTNYLQLTYNGLSLMGTLKKLHITGYQNLTLLTTDASESQIDPGWLIDRVCAELLLNHVKSPQLDIPERITFGSQRLTRAEAGIVRLTTSLMQGTRKI